MDTDQYSAEETKRRVTAAVKGAFSGPPTPLKDIPKRNGESRSLKRRSPPKQAGTHPSKSKKKA